MLMVDGICFISTFEVFFQQMLHIKEHSLQKDIYDGFYFKKFKKLDCTDCNSAIYGLDH